MFPQLDDGDWFYVFAYASSPVPVCPPGYPEPKVSADSFNREDVAYIISMVDGENDGADWVGVFLLNDGRWASIRAWCDYTGWG